ncbi:MAG: hypothetical protein WCE44_01115, partial [Candidatus Velthaea sp.]
ANRIDEATTSEARGFNMNGFSFFRRRYYAKHRELVVVTILVAGNPEPRTPFVHGSVLRVINGAKP